MTAVVVGGNIIGAGTALASNAAAPSIMGTGTTGVPGASVALPSGGITATGTTSLADASLMGANTGAGSLTPAAASAFSWTNPTTWDWGTILPTVGTIGGGIIQSNASKEAAASSAAASAAAIAENRRQYDLSRSDMAPWLTTGTKALSELGSAYGLDGTPAAGIMDKVRATPGYQFRLGEGTRAMEGGAAASGGLFRGATGRALNEYGQDYATNEFGNYTNRLAALSGTGQTAATNLGSLSQNYSTNFGNLTTNAANVAGADALNRGNIWGSTLTGLSNLYARR
jgi:hypothetical protein